MHESNIDILFEDTDVVVVNKPAGLVVHSDGKTKESTLVDWVLLRYPQTSHVGEPFVKDGTTIVRPGIVHRLDRETSGVLVIAKTQKAFEHLKRQFQDRKVEKSYNAFVDGEMKNDNGVIDRPIGKSASDFRLRSATRGARGTLREAITEYTVLKRGKGVSFLDVRPKTGRTHQIRVHLKAVNHPVVCDALYASAAARTERKHGHPCKLGFTRLALHARTLSFTTLSGNALTVEAPLPDDFIHAIKLMDAEHTVAEAQAL